jgi:photosystem II stability/assembly factor-like uncharacterized protein
MVNAQTGWGWSAHLLARTTDSAQTFVDRTPTGIGNSEQISAVGALDSSDAWVVVGTFPSPGTAALYRTANAGASWIRTSLPAWGRVHFLDRMHGWLLASQQTADHRAMSVTLYRTVDGGASWKAFYRTTQGISIEPNVQVGDCQWTDVTFVTAARGYAGLTCPESGAPQMDVTDDGGSSWHRISVAAPPLPNGVRMWFSAWQPVFGTALDGSAFVEACIGDGTSCSFYGALDRTVDGGRSWVSGPMVFGGGGGMALLPDGLHGWLPFGCLQPCGHQTVMLRTGDGGLHWMQLFLRAELGANRHGTRSFELASPTVGFATSSQALGSTLRFFRTADGGTTFSEFTPMLQP